MESGGLWDLFNQKVDLCKAVRASGDQIRQAESGGNVFNIMYVYLRITII